MATFRLRVLSLLIFLFALLLLFCHESVLGGDSQRGGNRASSRSGAPLPREGILKVTATPPGYEDEVGPATFSANCEKLALRAEKDVILLIDVSAPEPERTRRKVKVPNRISACPVFSGDQTTLVVGSVSQVTLLDVASGRVTAQVRCGGIVRVFALSPDRRTLATVTLCHIDLWDIESGNRSATLSKHTRRVNALAFSPDGATLASTGEEGGGYLWDLASKKPRAQLPPPLPKFATRLPHDDTTLCFLPDGQTLLYGDNHNLQLWNLRTGSPCQTILADGYMTCSSADGRMLVRAHGPGTITTYETITGRPVWSMSGHKGDVISMAFTNDNRKIVSLGADGVARVWDLLPRPGIPVHHDAELTKQAMERAWQDLGGEAVTAFESARGMVHAPVEALKVLRARLAPAAPVAPVRLSQLIAALGDDRFEVREAASADLAALGHAAESGLREALGGNPSPEIRRRATDLLNALEQWQYSGAQLRRLRAIQAIEWIGSPEARTLLAVLAGGDPNARETQDAKAALERLDRRLNNR